MIAVVIPTLDEERFIAPCLDCVIGQTFPFEEMDVMVVDGGSEDHTCEIVCKYHDRFPNIRLLKNPKKNQAAAFNLGVRESDAPYIIRLDAHALYKDDYIERCVEGLKSNTTRGNVGGRWQILPSDQTLWARANAILNCSRFGIGDSAYRLGAKQGCVDTVPFGAFRRDVIEKIGEMREDLPRAEDNEYNSRIRKAGYTVYFDPEIVSSYYARPTLSASCRQMYGNGAAIGFLLYADRESIALRHLVPLCFVASILIGVLLILVCPLLHLILCSGLCLYFCCDVAASFLAAKKHGWRYFLPLFLLFFCVHVSYGWGTIVGLIKGRRLCR